LSFENLLSTNKQVHLKFGPGIFIPSLSSSTPTVQCLSQNTQPKHNNNTKAIQAQKNKDPIKLQHNKRYIFFALNHERWFRGLPRKGKQHGAEAIKTD